MSVALNTLKNKKLTISVGIPVHNEESNIKFLIDALFIKHPILCSYIFIINKCKHYFESTKEKSLNDLWDIAFSSKSLSDQN